MLPILLLLLLTTYIKAIRSTHTQVHNWRKRNAVNIYDSQCIELVQIYIYLRNMSYTIFKLFLASGRKTQTVVHETKTQKKIIKIINYRRNSWLNSEGNGACLCVCVFFILTCAHRKAHRSACFIDFSSSLPLPLVRRQNWKQMNKDITSNLYKFFKIYGHMPLNGKKKEKKNIRRARRKCNESELRFPW